MIHGITIQLLTQKISGYDWAHCPIYTENPIEVKNVLVM